ncbi:MAG TPA: hypothetical protein VFW06_08105 [Acidimicrobiia bacterium]|nr:hypothetical protein [Acidimicrobiia bacterium]
MVGSRRRPSPRARRARIALCAGALIVLAVLPGAGARSASAVLAPSTAAFRGLGTWVDVYDYVPGFQEDGGPPPVTVDSIDDMERLGVRTLYLQSAQDDSRLSGRTVDRKLLGSFLGRAHDVGIEVVAWYLPKLAPVSADLRRIEALERFESRGERFDGIALDIEWTQGVPDPAKRNPALVRLAKKARAIVEDRPLGAIVLEPLLLEEVNLLYWPDFPWKKLRGLFDVWMPMSYWTNRDTASGLRDGFTYTEENIRRVRKRLGDPEADVHAIGGIADSATTKDYLGFVKAAKKRDAIGWSVYDFNTTTSGVWARLRDS